MINYCTDTWAGYTCKILVRAAKRGRDDDGDDNTASVCVCVCLSHLPWMTTNPWHYFVFNEPLKFDRLLTCLILGNQTPPDFLQNTQ